MQNLFVSKEKILKDKISQLSKTNLNLGSSKSVWVCSCPTVAASLSEALNTLDKDRAFLTQGDVFSNEQIDGYIELKREEAQRVDYTPHPVEFDMYYSV